MQRAALRHSHSGKQSCTHSTQCQLAWNLGQGPALSPSSHGSGAITQKPWVCICMGVCDLALQLSLVLLFGGENYLEDSSLLFFKTAPGS